MSFSSSSSRSNCILAPLLRLVVLTALLSANAPHSHHSESVSSFSGVSAKKLQKMRIVNGFKKIGTGLKNGFVKVGNGLKNAFDLSYHGGYKCDRINQQGKEVICPRVTIELPPDDESTDSG
jgi:hypothetical protein